MSMKLKINNGKNFEITDDNKTIVSKDIADEINDKIKNTESDEEIHPDLTIEG